MHQKCFQKNKGNANLKLLSTARNKNIALQAVGQSTFTSDAIRFAISISVNSIYIEKIIWFEDYMTLIFCLNLSQKWPKNRKIVVLDRGNCIY